MRVLPDRPDLRQLRRQARELLRAATDGRSDALARLRAVSDSVTLSAAQLALAREYRFASWAALRLEVQRRRRLDPEPSDPLAFDDSRSFGGAAAIDTAAGTLHPLALVIGVTATLECWLTPADHAEEDGPGPSIDGLLSLLNAQQATGFEDVTVVDDHGTHYALRRTSIGFPSRATWCVLRLEPLPPRDRAWIELRNQQGDSTRLLRSPRRTARVGTPVPIAESPAERVLALHARSVVELHLNAVRSDASEDFLRQQRDTAIATASRIRRSGELDTASDLPDQLTRLCAALAGQYPIDDLPPAWSGVLIGAQRADGQCARLDVGATLPPIDGTVTRIDSIVADPESWLVYLRMRPGYWTYREDGERKWPTLTVRAEDDRGGQYVSTRHGNTGRGDHEEASLRFLPRIDPLARALTLTFDGEHEQVSVELDLGAPGGR